MSSAWEQWGGKRPAGSGLAVAQDAFQGLLRSSPLSSSSASTASTSSAGGLGGDLTPSSSTPSSAFSSPALSLQKAWASARDLTKSVVSPASNAGPGSGALDAADAMESGQMDGEVDDAAAVKWPLWRKNSATDATLLPTMSWNTRFKYFVGMALMGLLFFGMASIFLPLIMIRPSKFALSFTLGSMCSMGAFAMLKGPAAYAASLLQPNRLPLTTAYFVTLGATLYSCLVLGNYIFVVLSSVLQLLTLGTFAMSAFPGGNASLKAFGSLFWKTARRMVQAFARLLQKMPQDFASDATP